MKTISLCRLGPLGGILALAAAVAVFCPPIEAAGRPRKPSQPPAQKTIDEGNFAEAYETLRKSILDPQGDSTKVGEDLARACQCLQRLNRTSEINGLLEEAAAVHKDHWRPLWGVARSYMDIPHYGFIVAGKFQRGQHRGGGEMVGAVDRDRVRALQLMAKAMPSAVNDDIRNDAAEFLLSFARMLLANRGHDEVWRLQYLTDLKTLPDYEENYYGWRYGRSMPGAPVDAEGRPVFYTVPRSIAAAANDGQRWRWCLEQAVEISPAKLSGVRMAFAEFLENQFGVQTMAQSGWRFGRTATDDTQEDESGTYALHTLKDTETIARLATGIKRFDLPDEFNYIKIYQQIADQRQGEDLIARERLARIFENRRQYPKAAQYWRELLAEEPTSGNRDRWKAQLDQIVGAWGRFEPCQTQPAGRGATVDYRFRNGTAVEFTAQKIKVEKLLDDVKALLKSNPRKLEWNKTNIDNIGHRLVVENQTQYVEPEVIDRWRMPLRPRKNHFDDRVTVATPLQTPGAYLVTAKMAGGNTSKIVVWIDDTAIVKKPLSGKSYYFVADAASGKPIARASLDFFGWRQQWHDRPPRSEVLTREFAEHTDADGQAIVDAAGQESGYQWLVTARTADGRFAYLGFTHVWYGQWYDAEYRATKVFTITDRPVYRPEQKVQYKFWVRHARYDMEDTSDFAGRRFSIVLRNPKGENKVLGAVQADAWGGVTGEYALPADAMLGVYWLGVEDPAKPPASYLGGGTFRVEEYKKPEYEVTVDAPERPVMLGEKITATIRAKYYFGSPVTRAKVKYKINRTAHDGRWYPVGPWDWFYGPGYWWYAYDYTWYPGWKHWGCPRPIPFWWPHQQQPPELIADREVEIGPDGTVKVEIDTAVAKALHPDSDHSYTITAEVIDASRRTIVGTGNVLVARKPFTVYAWLDRGYYRIGDTIMAHLSARTLDGKPVEGSGELRLLKITYKDGKPVETPVGTWKVNTNAEGTAHQQMVASEAGQYRVSYRLVGSRQSAVGSAKPQAASSPQPLAPSPSVEGGYVFTVIGQGFDGSQFRFNHLELIPDKREYAPGDKVKLQINTDRTGGTVLLFLRPTNGLYLPPTILRLDGKSTIQEVGVVKKDMPNFFVEVVTVADGRVHCETKEIVVPPEKRILNVAVQPMKLPSPSGRGAGGEGKATQQTSGPHPNPLPAGEGTTEFKPGEKAKVKVKLTDLAGNAFVGSTVVAIYDKALEYISGGSNVPEIKEFFWKWRRHHSPQTESSLGRWFANLVLPNTQPMSDLGVFGGSVVDDAEGAAGPRNVGKSERYSSADLRKVKSASESSLAFSLDVAALPAVAATESVVGKGLGKPGWKPAAASFGAGAAPMVEPTVRTKFADTALWVGSLTTNNDGMAEVSLDMPENLTTWRIKVWGMGHGTRVGQGFTDVVTRKDLIIRLEAPRFFVQNDEVVLSAIVHNYLKTKKKASVQLEVEARTLKVLDEGSSMEPYGGPAGGQMESNVKSVMIQPNGEARVDWRVKVVDEGQTTIRMKVLTDEESDAMEQKFPCYVHGMAKMDSYSGAISPLPPGEGQGVRAGKFTINVPAQRRPAQSRLEVRFSPTLAGAMVDALPYMVDYPYGCTEQTLNRFLPTVITQKILLDMKLDLKEIEKKQTNLNAQEIGDDRQRAEQWKRLKKDSPHPNPLPKGEGTGRNPVFDQDEVRRMVTDGVERLTAMQCSDGGWGWFSGWGEYPMPHTTAVVIHGLQIAKTNDVAIVSGVLERGVAWLVNYQNEQVQLLRNAALPDKDRRNLRWKESADNLDAFVYMVLADADVKNVEMCEFLYRDRTHLSVYALAMYGLALEKQGEKEKLAMVLRNIGQYVHEDDENQTAWLDMPEGCWWCWYGSEFEAEAYYLKLLARTDPKGERARRLVKYLLNNRKNSTYWNSTRDTALCIEAMADFIRASHEDRPNMTVEVIYDGKLQKTVEITPQNLFQFDNKFVLEGNAVETGRHTVELRKKGAGPLYYNGYLSYFTLEDFIPKSTSVEVKADRHYYKLVKADKSVHVAGSHGQVVDQKVEKYERQELKNLSEVRSGDLVEIELVLDSKNDYEYMIVEDMKPAGFEPVDLRSGYNGNDMGAYVEFRDNRVVFFVRVLARGRHSVAYRMRAETPGRFSALPAGVSAMYAPELRANSDELKLRVKE
jgi:alpha-2-macroglobulin